MSSSRSSTISHKSKAPDKSTDWCEWTWDRAYSRWFRSRQAAEGDWIYDYDVPSTWGSPRDITEAVGPYGNSTAEHSYFEARPDNYAYQSHQSPQSSSRVDTLANTTLPRSGTYSDTQSTSPYTPLVSGSQGYVVPQPSPPQSFPAEGPAYSTLTRTGGYSNDSHVDKGKGVAPGYIVEEPRYFERISNQRRDPYTGFQTDDVYTQQPTSGGFSNAYSAMSTVPNPPPRAGEGSGAITPTPNRIITGVKGAKEGQKESLDSRFKVHHSSYFKVGHVFKVLWSEPHGQSQSDATSVTEFTLQNTKFGQKVYSSVRRFVIIAADKTHCQCLPILTYSGKATTKSGVKGDEHAIIYTGDKPPSMVEGEEPLAKEPIQVVPRTPRDKLEKKSRVNYAKIYTVEHNVKVFFIGCIAKSSWRRFATDHDAAWNAKRRHMPGVENYVG